MENESLQSILDVNIDTIVEEGIAARKKLRKKILVCFTAAFLVGLLVAAKIFLVPYIQYNLANTALVSGDYLEAIDAYEKLGNYKDSQLNKMKATQGYAVQLLENSEYEAALEYFQGVPEGMSENIKECYYQLMLKSIASESWDDAESYYKNISGYKNSSKALDQGYLKQARELLAKKEYEKALEFIKKCRTKTEDALRTQADCNYQIGLSLLEEEKYEDAAALFSGLLTNDDYSDDATEQLYLSAKEIYKDNQEKAIEYFTSIKDYSDVEDYLPKPEPEKVTDDNSSAKQSGQSGKTSAANSKGQKSSGNTSKDTTSKADLRYGTSTKLPDTAVPLTYEALQGTWLGKSDTLVDKDTKGKQSVDYLYFLTVNGTQFTIAHYNCIAEDAQQHLLYGRTEYKDVGYLSVDAPNIVVTYRRYSVWTGNISDWKTETWPVEYIHPGGIRFQNGLLGLKSYYACVKPSDI